MDHLPVEVLLNVFSFVPKEELVTTVPQVCKHWKNVAADPSLFRTLDLVNDDPDTETSIRLLSAATWLTSLKLSGRTDTDVLIPYIGVNHPRLVKLVILECRGSRSKEEVSDMELLYLVRRCSTLQQFSLLDTVCYSEELPSEIGLNLHDLRDVEVSLLMSGSKVLIGITNHCTRIERIILKTCGGYSISSHVASFCDKFKESLTSIMIEDATWTNASLTALSKCRNVKELYLRVLSENLTEEGIMSLCQLMHLETLTIHGEDNITSMGLVRLFKNASMKSLVKLCFIEMDNLDDLVAIAISLLPNLMDLDIEGDRITDEGLLSLSNIPNLTRLTIDSNLDITSRGWIRYFETSNVQQKMTHLDLFQCLNVNDEVKQVISQNLRALQQMDIS